MLLSTLATDRRCWSGYVIPALRASEAVALMDPSKKSTMRPLRFAFWIAPRDSFESVEYSLSLIPCMADSDSD
ncbi:MAG: hypothetical protein JKY41_07620 [Rhodobacteraceae bacterium]|nr:hypothetical protein [Paracoccaceae bacterium]